MSCGLEISRHSGATLGNLGFQIAQHQRCDAHVRRVRRFLSALLNRRATSDAVSREHAVIAKAQSIQGAPPRCLP